MVKKIEPVDWLKKHMPTYYTCSYYLDTNQGTMECDNDICHARALPNGYDKREINAIHSCLPSKGTGAGKNGIRYYDFLFDKKRSPYREAFNDLKLYHNDDGTYIGFSLLDTNVRTCLVGSLLIASRLPWELPEKCKTFIDALDMGFKDTEAYLIAHVSTPHWKNGQTLTVDAGQGHRSLYGMDFDRYGYNYKQDLPRYDIEGMNTGRLNYALTSNGEAIYGKNQSCHSMYKMFFNPKGRIHPFNCDIANVEVCYYTGKFGKLAKKMQDFPMPFEPYAKGGKILTLKQLFETRSQWSAL